MSSIRRVARAIRQQDKETVENRVREIEYADVKRVNPLALELHNSRIGLDEGDDLTLSQWVRSYHRTVGINRGDTLAVKRMRSGKWLATDVINDKAPLFRGVPSGGTSGQVLGRNSEGELEWVNSSGGGGGGSTLPTGGTTGQVLSKASNDDGDANWRTISEVPSGGTTGQVLKKASNTSGDLVWGADEAGTSGLPAGGTTGQVLKKASNTTGDVTWGTDETGTPELPSGGTTGQVLKKASSTTGDVVWATDEVGTPELPAGGTTGQVLKKASNTTGDVVWATDEAGGGGGGDTPSGAILAWPTATAPTGWLICDGQALSTTTYADLFAVVGYTYGGSGSTFNLPNMKGRVPVGLDSAQTEFDALGETGGAKTHTLTSSEMPGHTHGVGTLATDSTGSHSHGVGTLATNSTGSHSHSAGTLGAVAGGSHTHGVGTLATNTTGSHSHTLTGGSHAHSVDLTYFQGATGGTGATRTNIDATGSTKTLATTAVTPVYKMDSQGSHSHTLSGSTGSDGSHSHSISGTTGSDGSHSHTISGSTASDGSHSHTVSGSTGSSGGGGAHANLPPYITLNYIIKA